MVDLIFRQLKQFEDKIDELPRRRGSDEIESCLIALLENKDNEPFSITKGAELLNEFMGYVTRISEVKATTTDESDREFTLDQIAAIIEIDGLFQTYFEDNLIVPMQNRAHNKNARTPEQEEEQLAHSIAHAFRFSSDSRHDDTVYNKYMAIKIGLCNYASYAPVFDRIMDIDIDVFSEKLSPEEIAEIESFVNAALPLHVNILAPSMRITLPKAKTPK